jgi:predicted nucleotidyltransferase
MGLKFYLEDLFGRRVDLVLTDAIKPALRRAILSDVGCAAGATIIMRVARRQD